MSAISRMNQAGEVIEQESCIPLVSCSQAIRIEESLP